MGKWVRQPGCASSDDLASSACAMNQDLGAQTINLPGETGTIL
jgi:hypothetical protein